MAGPERQVLLFTIDAGGGHRSATRALVAAAEELGTAWSFRVESFQQILLPLDLLHRLTGVSLEDAYNLILRRNWNVLMVPLLRLMHTVIRMRRPALVRTLAAWLGNQPPAATVVSVMPNFNGVMRDAIREAWPGVPLVVVLTDLADFPPRFWIEPGIDRVVVGTEEARQQALTLGLDEDHVSRVSGMILNPSFYQRGGVEAGRTMRREMAFEADDRVITLLFGGKGSPAMLPLARGLLKADPAWRIVAICGDNPGLLAGLAPLEERHPGRLRRLGFTDRVAELMAASDVLVTKPGPGSLAEAFQQRVPVVVIRNRDTIPQERFNTDYVARHELGRVVGDWREIPAAVAALCDPQERERIGARVAALPPNRAVYEVLEIVEDVIDVTGSRAG